MKLFKMMAVGMIAAAMMSSCDSDDDYGNKATVVYTNCLNCVDDASTGTQYVSGNKGTTTTVGYSLNFDFDKKVVSVGIAGLKLGEGEEAKSMDLYEMPMVVGTYTYTVVARDIQPYSNGMPMSGYMVDTFTMTYYNSTTPMVSISYEINGRYEVTVLPVESVFGAETTVTTLATGDEYETTDPYYGIVLSQDETSKELTADVHVYNAKFAANMPPQSEMVFKGVGVDVVDGVIRLQSDRVVPEVANTPYERFMITNLNARCYIASGIAISYEVAGTWKVVSESQSNALDY